MNTQKSDAEFEQWVTTNPHIWSGFCEFADKMRAVRSRYSARAVLHVLRWHRALSDKSDPLFKINNNWSARMARKYNEENDVKFFSERNEK